MMKKIVFQRIYIALLCASLLFGGTYAWYSNYHQLEVSGEAIQLDYTGAAVSSFIIYKYDQDTGLYEEYTEEEYSAKALNMTPYDSIFFDRNVNTPLIFQIELTGDFTGKTPDITMQVTSSSKYWRDYDTSNLVYIKATEFHNVFPQGSAPVSVKDKYTGIINYFAKIEQESKFIKANPDFNTLIEDSEDNPKYINTNIANFNVNNKTQCTTNKMTIYCIFDYDAELVENQEIANFNEIEIHDNEYVNYYSDITGMRFFINT